VGMDISADGKSLATIEPEGASHKTPPSSNFGTPTLRQIPMPHRSTLAPPIASARPA
jgi:hypothetical protein